MKYAIALLIAIILLSTSGCIAAARKAVGTVLGPSGKMVIVEDNWKIEPGQSKSMVSAVNKLLQKRLAVQPVTLLMQSRQSNKAT